MCVIYMIFQITCQFVQCKNWRLFFFLMMCVYWCHGSVVRSFLECIIPSIWNMQCYNLLNPIFSMFWQLEYSLSLKQLDSIFSILQQLNALFSDYLNPIYSILNSVFPILRKLYPIFSILNQIFLIVIQLKPYVLWLDYLIQNLPFGMYIQYYLFL